MKILHVTKKYPRALGGDAVVVANLQKHQQSAGHEVLIVTSNCNEIVSDAHVIKFGFKDTPANLDAITFKRVASLIVLFFRMFALLKKHRPDVIHTHSIDMAFFASFAARFYGIPILHTFHIVTFYDHTQSALRRKSELWLAKHAKLRRATAPNAHDVQKLQNAGLTQTVLLHNGVDMPFWEKASRRKNSSPFIFLAVGRLEPQKGYEYLIKAALLLSQTTPTAFRIVIVGEGSEKTALQNLIHSLCVEDIVSLVGRKNQNEIRALFSGAGAVVNPSLYETTPLTLLEAWAAAVPAIITPVGILRDVPADFNAAYIVPPKNEQALAQAMQTCMSDAPLRSAIAANGNTEVKKYTWPKIAKATEAIYGSAQ
jgi:glycosyltransferase involved in cell wall biosynthesis